MFTAIAVGAFLGCCVLSTLPDKDKKSSEGNISMSNNKSYNDYYSNSTCEEQVEEINSLDKSERFSKDWVRENLPRNQYDNWECDDIMYELKDNWNRQDVEKMLRRGYTFAEAIEELHKER